MLVRQPSTLANGSPVKASDSNDEVIASPVVTDLDPRFVELVMSCSAHKKRKEEERERLEQAEKEIKQQEEAGRALTKMLTKQLNSKDPVLE